MEETHGQWRWDHHESHWDTGVWSKKMSAKNTYEVTSLKNRHQGSAASTVSCSTGSGGSGDHLASRTEQLTLVATRVELKGWSSWRNIRGIGITMDKAKQLVRTKEARLKQDDLNMFDWELTTRDIWHQDDGVLVVQRGRHSRDAEEGSEWHPARPYQWSGPIHRSVRATLELDPLKGPWNKAQAIFFGVMTQYANLPREAFDIRWVVIGLRVSVAIVHYRRKLDKYNLKSFVSSHRKWTSKFFRLLLDAWRRSSPWLLCTITLNREKGDWCCEWFVDLRHKHHILYELPCFMHCKRLIIGRLLRWTFVDTLCMVLTMVVQPFWSSGRLITFVAQGLTTRDAPPSWWARRCCFQFTCRTMVAMRWSTSKLWNRWELLSWREKEWEPWKFHRRRFEQRVKVGTRLTMSTEVLTALNGMGCMELSVKEVLRTLLLTRRNLGGSNYWKISIARWRASGSRGHKKQFDSIMGSKGHFLVITRVEGREIRTKKRVKGLVRVDARVRRGDGQIPRSCVPPPNWSWRSRSVWNWRWRKTDLSTW